MRSRAAFLGVLALAWCAACAPEGSTEPSPDEVYSACAAPEGCYTSRFESAAGFEDFMDGVEIGPGGVHEMTATSEGVAATAVVGLSMANAASALGITSPDVVVHESPGCRFLWNPDAWIGMAVDDQDLVVAYYFENPVIKTVQGAGVGTPTAQLVDLEPVQVGSEGGMTVAWTEPTPSAEPLYDGDTRRMTVFSIDEENEVVQSWRVGIPAYLATENMCP
jgi:hypothetical protein